MPGAVWHSQGRDQQHAQDVQAMGKPLETLKFQCDGVKIQPSGLSSAGLLCGKKPLGGVCRALLESL